jgi:hypothetical protein
MISMNAIAWPINSEKKGTWYLYSNVLLFTLFAIKTIMVLESKNSLSPLLLR